MIVSHETRRGFVITETLEYQQPDGSTGLKEQVFFYGKLNAETEVDPNSYLYHGKEIYYSSLDANTVQSQGTWSRGKLDGPYNTYDEQGDLMRVTVYDNGNFVSRKVKVNGQWTEKNGKTCLSCLSGRYEDTRNDLKDQPKDNNDNDLC